MQAFGVLAGVLLRDADEDREVQPGESLGIVQGPVDPRDVAGVNASPASTGATHLLLVARVVVGADAVQLRRSLDLAATGRPFTHSDSAGGGASPRPALRLLPILATAKAGMMTSSGTPISRPRVCSAVGG